MEFLVQIPERCRQLQNWKAISSVGRWRWLQFQRLLQRDPIVTVLECTAHTSMLSTLPLSLTASSSPSTFSYLLAASFPCYGFCLLPSLCASLLLSHSIVCPFSLWVSLKTPQERARVAVQSPSGSRQRIPMKQQASGVAAQTIHGWLSVSCPSSCLLGAPLPKKHLKWLWIQQDCFHSMSSTRLIS